jgi:hypothetical protein
VSNFLLACIDLRTTLFTITCFFSRNGMTPLLLACAGETPDPETVRVLLDRGAHPNWRDAKGRTSFDLVLDRYKAKVASKLPEMDLIEYFVQTSLPVMMELVKKGARYSPDSISSLRSSFQVPVKTLRTSAIAHNSRSFSQRCPTGVDQHRPGALGIANSAFRVPGVCGLYSGPTSRLKGTMRRNKDSVLCFR